MKKLLKSLLLSGMCLIGLGVGLQSAALAADKPTTFGLKPFAQKQTLRIGFFAGGPFNMPFYIADKEGFFKELNIDVTYETFTNGPAMMEANASWDIAGAGAGGTLVGMLGYDVKTIGVVDNEVNIALLVRPDSPLAKDAKNPDNWRGTSWLYPIGTTAQPVLAAALKQAGLTFNDIKSVNMDVASALTGFMRKQGDGIAVWNTIALTGEDQGLVRIGDAGTFKMVTPATILATKGAIEKKKELLTAAYIVFMGTAEWIKKNPANMKKSIDHFLKSTRDEGLSINLNIATRAMGLVDTPTVKRNFEGMTKLTPDATGSYTKRPVSQAEKDLLFGVMQFYINEKKYSVADRDRILDSKGIDPVIAIEASKTLTSLGL